MIRPLFRRGVARLVAYATILCTATVASALVGGAAVGSTGAPLTVDIGAYITTLDPASACTQINTGITQTLYAELTRYSTKPGPHGTLQESPAKMLPYLATSWSVSNGGKTYTFQLHPGMKFPNGDPVDSAAVKFSILRAVAINGCGEYGVTDGLPANVQFQAIDTPSPTTVVFHLGEVNNDFLQDLAQWSGAIVDPALVNANGGVVKNTPNAWMADNDAGYGPYLIQSYQPNKQLVLTANPNFIYPPRTHEVIINFYNSAAALSLATQSGSADITEALTDQAVHALVNSACCRVVSFETALWDKIILPNTVYPFTNKDFRAALSYAVPYQEILREVYYGYGVPFYGIWSPAEPWYNPKIGAPRAFDLAKARTLLKASRIHLPISFRLEVVEGNEIQQSIATIVKAEWAKLGVNANIDIVTPAVQAQDAYSTYKYAVIWIDGPGVVEPAYQWFYDGECGSAFNSDRFCSKAADKLAVGLRSATSLASEEKITNKLDQIWVAQSPRIPVMQEDFVVVLNKAVKHYTYLGSEIYAYDGF